MPRAQFLRLLPGAAAAIALPQARAAGGYDFWFTRLPYESGDRGMGVRMPSKLFTALIDYTRLHIDPQEHVPAPADPAMLLAPLCYLAEHKLAEFNADERRHSSGTRAAAALSSSMTVRGHG